MIAGCLRAGPALVFAPLIVALLAAAPVPAVTPALGGTPWTADAIAKLDLDLDAMLGSSPALRGAHFGVLAIDTASGNILYAHAADDEFQPASTLKLLVGSTALERLGPDHSFTTDVLEFQYGSRLRLVGGGDPTLTDADLDEAARSLYGDGYLHPQNVDVDASHFDSVPYPNGWTWDDFGQDYAPVVSALPYEEDLVHIHVEPGAAGQPATASTADAAVLEVAGAAQGACGASDQPLIVPRVMTGAAHSDDTVDVAHLEGACPVLVGSIPQGAPADDIDVSVDPLRYARAAFVRALRNAGIVPAPPRSMMLSGPGPQVKWHHNSPPLSDLLGPRFWIPSDNLFGEVLLKELGYASDGATGTTAKGIAVEKTWLQSIGVDPATVTLADGCGMSQYDRITPRDLVAILQHDWNGPNHQLVLDSLPIGGSRGTIEGVAGTPAAGRVFAKTGSMMHVRGLAGYLATLQHGAVTFAFNVDDWNGEYPALAALRAQVLSRIVTDGS
jgi:serine-type D-Ala-D-Ala carboxypeptidase/endopeptidase (penicillin-binding protein 4)